jgi:hypothetical protein
MRIDSSGKLLIGTTHNSLYNSSTQADAGLLLDGANDNLQVARYEGTPLFLNRMNTDGELLSFRKDGAPVGSIGTDFDVVYLANGSNFGIRIDDAGNGELLPTNTTGSGADGVADLGRSIIRWKDLYLSGGVYLGGTTSANLLDDYEEGTFTPTVAGDATGVFGAAEGYYTKVGRLVFIELYFTVGTNFTSNTVGGLPFTVANLATGTSYGQSAVVLTSAADTVTGAAQEATTNATFYNDHNILSTHAPNTTNSAYRLSMCYQST